VADLVTLYGLDTNSSRAAAASSPSSFAPANAGGTAGSNRTLNAEVVDDDGDGGDSGGSDSKDGFEAQQVYSQIVTDATILCPNLFLATQVYIIGGWHPLGMTTLRCSC
jgi:hypothetical protein